MEGADNPEVVRMRQAFHDFLDHEFPTRRYSEEVRSMVDRGESRLIVHLHDLRDFDAEMARRLLLRPAEVLPVLDRSLSEAIELVDPTFLAERGFEGAIGVTGDLGGGRHVTPRGLRSEGLGRLICVDGIATRTSLVRPKVTRSVHYCEETQRVSSREYRDSTALDGLPTTSVYPVRDENDNPLTTEYGLCSYRDTQIVTLQEMPERAPAGQLPRSIDCVVEADLVDRVKPGDRVRMYGVFRALSGKRGGVISGVFPTVLIANNVMPLSGGVGGVAQPGPGIDEEDIRQIRKISRGKGLVELLSRSIAPSIYGHESIKNALLLVLLGGVEKNLANGTHLRGDCNVLLVGDPSTAKSQLLRFVMRIAPLAVSTTGRGATGVGLTAAVVTDKDTGERQLQAGAMVLADRGVVCIDEFDKMSDIDRVAMHEVMEQQTVTIAKAGVHTSLNARCAVVAAANPVYGHYDSSRRPMENIGLPDSLLSRFDLLFIVLDSLDEPTDRAIADHVLRLHRFRKRAVEDVDEGLPVDDGEVEDDDYDADDGGDDMDEDDDREDESGERSGVYQKYNAMLHRSRDPVLTTAFLRKYIFYAKHRVKPRLTQAASEVIGEAYSSLRNGDHGGKNTLPVTPRTLETLIRLGCAHAKARLSQSVGKADAEAAVKLLLDALYQEKVERPKRRRGKDDDDDEPGTPPASTPRKRGKRAKKKAKKKREPKDAFDFQGSSSEEDIEIAIDEDEEKEEEKTPRRRRRTRPETPEIRDRRAHFHRVLYDALRETHRESVSFVDLQRHLNGPLPSEKSKTYEEDEIEGYLREMESENKMMYREGTVYQL